MALRGKKPQTIEKRLKAFFYGMAGVGKTTAAIQFPAPYLIDTERGAENDQYIDLLDKAGGAIFQTNDFDDVMKEIKTLSTIPHGFKTLIIDPLTTVYNDLVDKSALVLKSQSKDPHSDGQEFGRHYKLAEKRIKHLMALLLRLDMNVIITSHAKKEYGDDMKVIGVTFDCYKKLDYLFDLVVEIQKRGKERVGIVRKSRIATMLDGDTFPFSYGSIADKYGREILERDAIEQVLATKEQVTECYRLIELLKIPDETTQKWLDKTDSATFDEMSADAIEKVIDYMKSKIKGEPNEI